MKIEIVGCYAYALIINHLHIVDFADLLQPGQTFSATTSANPKCRQS